LFGATNLGLSVYPYNLSANIGTPLARDNITARVCDAHTAVSIQSIDTKIKDKELKYVMDKFLIFEYEWIKVYPKDNINYDAPTTERKRIDIHSHL